ncbi:pilin [Variovorax sp. Sphag1AA]|uniref:pilin n=1 Tax=Variovorax sp. Sphag1AA TaxID=2587027 RepID=UPI00161713BC|nr:pilin [Variovorax sp. Sphag1AA]
MKSAIRSAQRGFTLIELMIVVAIIGIIAGVAIPQYQTYVAKSQVTRVVGEAGALKTAIEGCLVDGRLTLATNATVGATQCDPQATGSNLQATGGNSAPGATVPAGTGVPTVTMPAAATDATTIVATFGNNAAQALQAAIVTWTRTPGGTWSCSTTADARFAPVACPVAVAAP